MPYPRHPKNEAIVFVWISSYILAEIFDNCLPKDISPIVFLIMLPLAIVATLYIIIKE